VALLFRKRMIEKILRGEKTRTIRPVGYYKVGRTYLIQERPGVNRGRILMLRKVPKKLGELAEEDVIPDGFSSLEEFRREWLRMYRSLDPEQPVWLYDFEVVEVFDEPPASSRRRG